VIEIHGTWIRTGSLKGLAALEAAMFRKLVGLYREAQVLKGVKEHPVLGPVFHHVRDVLADNTKGVGKYWTDDSKNSLLNKILAEVRVSLTHANPKYCVRRKTFDFMCETATCQVLVVPPKPEADESGLRSQEGITGELKARIPELVERDNQLGELFSCLDEPVTTFDEMFNVVLLRYCVSHLWLGAFHVARCALKDYHDDPSKDWYRPCFVSQCICRESSYRKALGLSSALSGSLPDIRALMHSHWLDLIESGVQELRLEWENSWTATFHEPSPYRELPLE
jgi:hypothetical protein